jgi:hypothetical protein
LPQFHPGNNFLTLGAAFGKPEGPRYPLYSSRRAHPTQLRGAAPIASADSISNFQFRISNFHLLLLDSWYLLGYSMFEIPLFRAASAEVLRWRIPCLHLMCTVHSLIHAGSGFVLCECSSLLLRVRRSFAPQTRFPAARPPGFDPSFRAAQVGRRRERGIPHSETKVLNEKKLD